MDLPCTIAYPDKITDRDDLTEIGVDMLAKPYKMAQLTESVVERFLRLSLG